MTTYYDYRSQVALNPKYLCERAHTACFTGHRPEKIPFYDNEIKMRMLKSMLVGKIYSAVDDGYRTFVTGMARGVDLWGGQIVHVIKRERPELNIRLIGISPYRHEEDHRVGVDIYDYGVVREACDEMIYLADDFFPGCYHERNRLMIDISQKVIGVVHNYASGTGNTLREAKRQGLEIDVIDLNTCGFFTEQ